ncbi:orsellinic acid synthase [Colletotrichum spaethianum]|uniref:Orsellinic acid synthase n=1 Tax=Colletotrichum spaethianum TaxID=700344 RepID=A0AA37PCB6_9PEZI|nr:orsellinic acid synthase [Colletotrichum spaethianum]GKT49658.1 orsellinic acid synthase [Colletotrichum spaethianum]
MLGQSAQAVCACNLAAGTARNTNAGAAGSITFPSSVAQADLYRTLLQSNGVGPNEISYVECHGTGTQGFVNLI